MIDTFPIMQWGGGGGGIAIALVSHLPGGGGGGGYEIIDTRGKLAINTVQIYSSLV